MEDIEDAQTSDRHCVLPTIYSVRTLYAMSERVGAAQKHTTHHSKW